MWLNKITRVANKSLSLDTDDIPIRGGVSNEQNVDAENNPDEFGDSDKHVSLHHNGREPAPTTGVCGADKMSVTQYQKCSRLDSCSSTPLSGKEYAATKQFVQIANRRFNQNRKHLDNHITLIKRIFRYQKYQITQPPPPPYPLPSWTDKEGWFRFCFENMMGDGKENFDGDKSDSRGELKEGGAAVNHGILCNDREKTSEEHEIEIGPLKENGCPPFMGIIRKFNQRLIETLLRYHTEWIAEYGFTHQQARWIYALLIGLELPPKTTTIGVLRTLSKICAVERVNVAKKGDKSLLCSLNGIVAIIGDSFQQTDLLQ